MKLIFSDKEQQKFKALSVDALVLFGSRAQGTQGVNSDYDFGVLLKNKSALFSPEKRKLIYSDLYDILSEHIKELVNIDIVFLEDAPGELKAHVMKYGKPVFEVDRKSFLDFKASIIEEYADFAPLREIFHKGVLSNIK